MCCLLPGWHLLLLLGFEPATPQPQISIDGVKAAQVRQQEESLRRPLEV